MITSIFLNTWKNLKNIFRSWVSMSLLVIGPLLIIIILAFAFSSSGFRNVRMGYVNDANFSMEEIIGSLEYVGKFHPYTNIEVCEGDLQRQVMHGCVHAKPMGDSKVEIEAHFDNSREMISLILLEHIKRAVLEREDVIVEGAASNMLGEVSSVVSLMDEGETLLHEMIISLESQRADLVNARSKVQNARQKYRDTLYNSRSSYDSLVRGSADAGDDVIDEIDDARSKVSDVTVRLHSLQDIAEDLNDSYTADQISDNILYLQNVNSDLYSLRYRVESGFSTYGIMLNDFEEVLQEAEDVDSYFDDALSEINTLINDLDSKIGKLKETKDRLYDEKVRMGEIAGIGTDVLLHPFEFEYIPLFAGSKRIQEAEENLQISEERKRELINYGSTQVMFPLVICILICFIAVILSNIIVLDEMHSPAYFRSFLIPTFRQVFTASLFLTSFIITLLQIGVLLLVAHYSFYLDIFANIYTILPIVIAISVIFSLYGMIIAYGIRNKASSLLVCTFLLVITFILSGTIFPVERMSLFMSTLASRLPFTISVSMLQQSLFYSVPLAEMGEQFGLLLVHVVLTAAVLAVVRFFSEFRKSREV